MAHSMSFLWKMVGWCLRALRRPMWSRAQEKLSVCLNPVRGRTMDPLLSSIWPSLCIYRSKTMKRREKEPATDKVQQKLNVSVLWHHGKWQMMCVNAVEPIWCERINSSGQVRHVAASLCYVCCDLLQRCCNKPSDCRETPRELEDKAANFKRE